jgi:hypothetical protein
LEFRGRELDVAALGVQNNGGRICDVAGVGGTDERVIVFDAEARMMTYSVRASGLPFFVDRLENTWPVSDDGHGGASVDVEIRGITKGIIGRLVGFPLGRILGNAAVGLPSDLNAHVETAAERLGPGSAPLVCTEGRPSVACWRLLATLREGGCELRYHGDLDWTGLQIAAAVLAEPGTTPWRMGADDYLAALDEFAAGGSTTGRERARLRGTATDSPWDPGLATTMRERGAVVYEEDIIDLLVDDLRTAPQPDSTG